MFCKYCGKQLADGTLFCPSCGNRLDPPQETPSQNPYTPPQQPASSQPQSGYSGQQPGGYTPPGSGYTPPTGGYTPGGYQSPQTGPSYGALPMNWYKFLIYFALFASCVINAITGIGLMTGMIYGEASSYVYAFFGGLRVVDLLIGAVMICVAVLAIIPIGVDEKGATIYVSNFIDLSSKFSIGQIGGLICFAVILLSIFLFAVKEQKKAN